MSPAFQIRLRGDDAELHSARPGERLALEELGRYVLHLDRVPAPAERQALLDAGFELLTSWSSPPIVGLLSFGNYIGERDLLGVRVVVEATKLGADGVAGILAEVTAFLQELAFAAATPLGFRVGRAGRRERRVTFHDFVLLRTEMLGREVGRRLGDHFLVIAEQPTHALETCRLLTPVWRARRLDPQAIRSLQGPHQRYVTVEEGVTIGTPLIHETEGGQIAATTLAEPRRALSYDTPENRFVRFFLTSCLETAASFVSDRRLNETLRQEARVMVASLQEMGRATFLTDVAGTFSERPTMSLLRRSGYRDLFDLQRRLQEAPVINVSEDLLDGKDVPRLFEYWCFIRVVRACSDHLGAPVVLTGLRWDERLVLIPNGCLARVGPAEVFYNATFRAGFESYSVDFRPDITLRLGEALIVLDAKYRLRRLDLRDRDEAESPDERVTVTFQRSDLDKMHSYRDALRATAAIALYPGDEFHFFEAEAREHRHRLADVAALAGVGMVPLRPGVPDDDAQLRALVATFVSASGYGA